MGTHTQALRPPSTRWHCPSMDNPASSEPLEKNSKTLGAALSLGRVASSFDAQHGLCCWAGVPGAASAAAPSSRLPFFFAKNIRLLDGGDSGEWKKIVSGNSRIVLGIVLEDIILLNK